MRRRRDNQHLPRTVRPPCWRAAVAWGVVVIAAQAVASAATGPPPRLSGPPFDRLCATTADELECAGRVEREQLRHAGPSVARHGRTLAIRVATGRTVFLHDRQPGHGAGVSYRYLDYLPGMGRHIVYVRAFDDSSFLLVGARDGSRVEVDERPQPSPDGRRVLVTRDDPAVGNLLEVWAASGAEVKREWAIEPAWGLSGVHWSSPTRIDFDRLDTEGNLSGRLALLLEAGQWKLTDAPPPARATTAPRPSARLRVPPGSAHIHR